MTTVIFQNVREWVTRDIVDLYRSAGWWEEYYDSAEIPSLIQGSFIFVVGISTETGRAVAMGRIISDRVQTGYIQDLCVLKEVRGNRIGTRLLQFLIQAGRNAGLASLHLVAEPGTSSFYEKSGFLCENGMIFLTRKPGGTYET